MREMRLSNQQLIAGWFENHIREAHWIEDDKLGTGEFEYLLWRQPGTGNCLINYLRHNHRLFVSGDLGESVYQWSEIKPLQWMAGLNLDYFAGKCEASETGREYFEWNETIARKSLTDFFNNYEEPAQQEAKARENGAFAALWSESEWTNWLQYYGHEVFGSDFYELSQIGRMVNLRCQAHLIGLKLAFKIELK